MLRRALVIGGVAVAMLLGPSGQWLASAGEPQEEKGEEGKFCQALEATIEGELPLEKVRLGVTDRTNEGWRSMVVYGDGVGIWNGARQFRVKPKVVKKMVEMLESAHFCTMEGGQGEEEDNALRMIRGISVSIGELTKEVNQMERQTASPGFDALAARLLDTCRRKGETGVSAASLEDGLRKLREGTLAPQVLSVSTNSPGRGDAAAGWLLRVHGRDVVAQAHREGKGYGETHRGRLSDAEFLILAKELSAADLPAMPLNLYAAGYTDLSVSVLNQRRTLQARAFAGMSPTADEPAQARFERLRGALHALYLRVAASGKATD